MGSVLLDFTVEFISSPKYFLTQMIATAGASYVCYCNGSVWPG